MNHASEAGPCIRRAAAVHKSSSSPGKDRPSVAEHLASLVLDGQLTNPEQVTLVDDVLTQGRTMIGCALLLHEAYPDAQIRAFAMIRTRGLFLSQRSGKSGRMQR
jgi:predicted amidophosphoribosyltransferase